MPHLNDTSVTNGTGQALTCEHRCSLVSSTSGVGSLFASPVCYIGQNAGLSLPSSKTTVSILMRFRRALIIKNWSSVYIMIVVCVNVYKFEAESNDLKCVFNVRESFPSSRQRYKPRFSFCVSYMVGPQSGCRLAYHEEMDVQWKSLVV